MDFAAAHAAVKALIEAELPDCGMHSMHIQSKKDALAAITREADLAPDTELIRFSPHDEISKMIRSFMKNGK